MMWLRENFDGSLSQLTVRPGTAGEPNGKRLAQIPREIDFAHEGFNWATGAIEPRLTVMRLELLEKVDREREAARHGVMTQALGQSFVYAEKAREVYDYRNVVGGILATLTMPQRLSRFPFAMAEVSATGDALATVIARFEAGATASRTKIARIDALAMKAKAAIRAATTLQQMQTAAAVNWEN